MQVQILENERRRMQNIVVVKTLDSQSGNLGPIQANQAIRPFVVNKMIANAGISV